MTTLTFSYLFRRLSRNIIIITFIFVAIFWLVQILNTVDDYLILGASGFLVLELSLLFLPALIHYILGPALLIGTIILFHRMFTDQEYFIFLSAGVRPWVLLKPVMVLTALVIGVQVVLSFYVSPYALQVLRFQRDNLERNYIGNAIEPGVFRDVISNVTAYAESRNDEGTLNNVVVYDTRARPYASYIAKKGILTQVQSGAVLLLYDGMILRNEATGGQSRIISFSEYRLPILQKKRRPLVLANLHVRQLMVHQLIAPEKLGIKKEQTILKMRSYFFELVIATIAPLIFALLAAAFMSTRSIQRGGYARQVFITVSLAVFYYIVTSILSQNAAQNIGFLPFLIAWPCLVILTLGVYLFRRYEPHLWPR